MPKYLFSTKVVIIWFLMIGNRYKLILLWKDSKTKEVITRHHLSIHKQVNENTLWIQDFHFLSSVKIYYINMKDYIFLFLIALTEFSPKKQSMDPLV